MTTHDYEPRVRYWLNVLAEAGLEHLRPEAAELLADGWRDEDWAICVRAAELSLLGVGRDLSKSERRKLNEAPDALRISILYATGDRPDKPPPTWLGTGSGWSWSDDDLTAWSPSSGVDPDVDRRVRRAWRPRELPYQLELELDPPPGSTTMC